MPRRRVALAKNVAIVLALTVVGGVLQHGANALASMQSGSITITLAPSYYQTCLGGTAATTVAVQRTNFTGYVQLTVTVLPGGISSFVSDPGYGNTGTIVFVPYGSMNPGTYLATVTALAPGVVSGVASFRLEMFSCAANQMRISPAGVTLVSGGRKETVTVTFYPYSQCTSDLALILSELPGGVTFGVILPSTSPAGYPGQIVLWADVNAVTVTNFPVKVTASCKGGSGSGASAILFVPEWFVVTVSLPPSPVVNRDGITNGASFAVPPRITPGAIASVFGHNLALDTALATTLPLPTALGGAALRVNTVWAPLFFVSPTQVNFQVPWELAGQTQVSVTVTTAGGTSDAQAVSLVAFSPGLFSTSSTGTGQASILISGSGEVAAPSGSIRGWPARPVKRGESISIFCTGLGDVATRPASGAPAPSDKLAVTSLVPTVTVGDIPSQVTFSGLAPGFVGLYQVNAQVPANAPTGDAVPVVLTIGAATSNAVTIAVQ
jgi:uncharacterized protein (TIGR03437 family)